MFLSLAWTVEATIDHSSGSYHPNPLVHITLSSLFPPYIPPPLSLIFPLLCPPPRDGVIEASIDHSNGWLLSNEVVDLYSTEEPQKAFHK